ncbi:MAG: DUF4358 domain-containing protein [Lachnospiraceae bacterium]|nr:DUF4358 domain-containing protein [Lachnospiraceae bacterium]
MKRNIVRGLTAVLALLFITGCGVKKADIEPGALADALKDGIAYKDELAPIDKELAGRFYSFGDADIEEAYFYESSGATAEEVAVVKCASDDGAKTVEEAFNRRIEEQKESFKDYVPAELDKLNSAVVMRKGKCVILSVSDEPDKAGKIINSAAK